MQGVDLVARTVRLGNDAGGVAGEQALSGMLERLASELLPLANALAGRDADPSELLADTLSRVYERYHQLEDPSKLSAWARRILVRKFLDQRRGLRRSARVRLELHEASDQAGRSGVPDATEIDLRRAMSRLPRRERALLVLHYWGGFTFRELAESLEIAEGTVKSRLHASLERLRADLGRQR